MTNSNQNHLLETFSRCQDRDDRFRELIKMGREAPKYPEEFRKKECLIEGCLSQLWLHPRFEDGVVHFDFDSDAAIPKGIAAVLVKCVGGSTPAEILSYDPTFLRELGIDQHLSMSRRNGLSNLVKQMKLYAMAFQAMAKGSSP